MKGLKPEPFQSLETLDRHDQTHNDIKPQNFLVKFKNGYDQNNLASNDFTQIEIALTDFGMAGPDSKGGTPIFASPECFEKKEKKSDIFSFGRVILFLLLDKTRFVKWLFVPLKNRTRFSFQVLTSADPEQSLNLISQMTSLTDRINLQAARELFDRLRRNSEISFNQVLVDAIDIIINGEMTNESEAYVSELCDFRFEKK